MTTLSPETISPAGSAAERLARISRLILLARASVTLERFLPRLWPALGFAAVYLSAALFGVFAYLPWILQALLLAVTITAIGLSLASGFENFAWANWKDGARRLEEKSGLKHRPISEGQDRLVGDDPFAMKLWALHQARALAFTRLTAGWPKPDLSARDPRYLRYGALLLLAASLAFAGPNWKAHLYRGFDSGAGMAVSLDAWVDPPPYTGMAPVYLAPGDRNVIGVPAGSVLNLRAHNAPHAPGLSLGGAFSLHNPPRFTGGNGEYTDSAKLTHDARVKVRANGHVIGDWRIRAIPDAVPVIAFDGVPSATERQAMKVSIKASDDYGVASAKLMIVPHGRAATPMVVDIPLAPGKRISQTNYFDLTAHPYAGLVVDAHLEARDAAGNIGKSSVVSFKLPARVFTDPLARALIEQRQNLATSDREGRRRVVAALDALSIAPEAFYAGKTGLYMGIRSAYWGVRTAREPADIAHVEELLWQIAVSLEQQGLLEAAAQLRQLQSQINQALSQHAPQDVIDELMKRYGAAMQKYTQALQNNPGSQQGQQQQQQMQGQNSKTITQKDLDDLLKAIQQMAAAGNREGAQQAMAMLQNMLENMKVSREQGGPGGQGGQQNKALNDAIQKFGDMMGQERSLLDKTMRQQQGNGDPKEGGAQGLAGQQQQLRQDLNKLMQSLDPKTAGQLGKAGEAMDRAQQSLNQKNLSNASNEEKKVLEELRQGANALAKQAHDNENSKTGEVDDDPLGRSRGATGNNVKIPDANDLARAREILQELRKRAGERGRPQQELDYYDRLLKEF